MDGSVITTIQEFIRDLSNLFSSVEGTVNGIGDILGLLESMLNISWEFVVALCTLLLTGTGLIILLAVALIIALILFLVYFLAAFPVYRIAKKAGYKKAKLAWIPFFHYYISSFLLCKASGKDRLEFFGGKFRIKTDNGFLTYLLLAFFGSAVVEAVQLILGIIAINPTAAPFAAVLYIIMVVVDFLPWTFCILAEFAYLRDVLDLFSPEKKSNRVAAIIVSLLDATITRGLARYVYLFTVMNKPVLPQYSQENQQVNYNYNYNDYYYYQQ